MAKPTAPPLADNERCHCGSNSSYARCCQPLHLGSSHATTAQQLMRSRFSAFCTANVDYLIATHHPSKRRADDKQQLRTGMEDEQWLQLKICNSRQGSATDRTGEVEFIAFYRQGERLRQLHENSRFVQEQERWYYLDGDMLASAEKIEIQLGRNDLCWCASGKKYKKCHG